MVGISQIKRGNLDKNKKLSGQNMTEKCSPNPDNLYNRQQVLEQLAKILTISIPEYQQFDSSGFYVENERGKNFFVQDLTDTSNKQTLQSCVNFINNHVYHFAPIYLPYSFSHILILEDGNLKIFKSINCVGRGDALEDVINYLNQKLKNDRNKEEVISRVKNYRRYGIYFTIDDDVLRCQGIK